MLPSTPHCEMASSGKPRFLQKKVLVVGIEDLKMLSIRNLLKQFSVYQNGMGRDFLRGIFGESRLLGDSSSCVLLGHLPSSFWSRSLVSKIVDFCLDGLYSTNFIRASG